MFKMKLNRKTLSIIAVLSASTALSPIAHAVDDGTTMFGKKNSENNIHHSSSFSDPYREAWKQLLKNEVLSINLEFPIYYQATPIHNWDPKKIAFIGVDVSGSMPSLTEPFTNYRKEKESADLNFREGFFQGKKYNCVLSWTMREWNCSGTKNWYVYDDNISDTSSQLYEALKNRTKESLESKLPNPVELGKDITYATILNMETTLEELYKAPLLFLSISII
jgi:hypothetical protein